MPEATTAPPLLEHPVGILAVLLTVLAAIFWFGGQPAGKRLFGIIPALVFCYFVPTTLTTFGVLPAESALYDWVKSYLLPCSLLLLILALDVPGILRLGPKAVIMLLAGTLGVVIGGPVSLWICMAVLPDTFALPPDIWRGMSALSGSWIGGGANMVALGDISEVTSDMFGLMVIVDVFVASVWMGVLLYLSGHQDRVDGWTGANTAAIKDLAQRIGEFQARVGRLTTVTDLLVILAIGFMGAWLSYKAGAWLADQWVDPAGVPVLSGTTWKFILVTALGVALSYSPARNLEGAGASKLGSAMIFLLVACIGASADFGAFERRNLGLLLMGFIWMAIHVTILLTVGRLIRAPIFFVAVGSQSNIGGAASAPVVAAAYHPTLAPVGALLAVAGYVLGTYAGLLCMWLLKQVAGA